jgi:predicted kinase
VHINPDHFLQTESGRVVTPERNRAAWERSYEALNEGLRNADRSTKVYVLVGSQGAGKSTWAESVAPTLRGSIVFDAILVKRAERRPILAAARSCSVGVVAVWFKTPLEVCISRNASRAVDEVVPVQAVRNVHSAIEPPSIAEGFSQVIEVLADETGA